MVTLYLIIAAQCGQSTEKRHRKGLKVEEKTDNSLSILHADLAGADLLPSSWANVPIKHRLVALGVLSGQSRAEAAKNAGYGPYKSKYLYDKAGSAVLYGLERAGRMAELLALAGCDDVSIASKFNELLNCGDQKVEASTLALLSRVKGYLSDKEETPAATAIHLHVMQRGESSTQPGDNAKQLLNMDRLLPPEEAKGD
jgi:hypothetical protein